MTCKPLILIALCPLTSFHGDAIGMIETLKAFLLHQFISPENDA